MFQSSRTRSRRRDREPSVWRHVFTGVGLVLLIIIGTCLVWYVTRLESVTIEKVVVVGGETIPHTVIQAEVERVLRGDYLKIVPHRFSLLYPHDNIAGALLAIDRVKSVQVDRKGKTSLQVSFEEYTPYALWCDSQNEPSDCFFMDSNGYAFAPSPKLTGGSFVRHTKEGEGEMEAKQVFDPDSLKRMHTFLALLQTELSLRVTHLLYTKEGDVQLNINGGGTVLLKNDTSYETAFENLSSVLSSKEFKHLEPGNFKYVDLRFGSKIFVNESKDVPSTTISEGSISTSTLEQ